jgi:hypothetical protein
MKKITRKALLTAKAYRPGKASGGYMDPKTKNLEDWQWKPLQDVRVGRAYGGRNNEKNNVWWHGSVSGDMRGGDSGLHLGTKSAAEDALHARIGFPAEGSWDGTRKYGETLLAGKKRILAMNPYGITGRNADAPDEDYYAHEHPKGPLTYSDGTPVPSDTSPSIRPFRITGSMTNTIQNPHQDFKANGYMAAAKKRGTARNGYFYKNEGEDYGSISAVVPDGEHVEEIQQQDDINKAAGGRTGFADGGYAYKADGGEIDDWHGVHEREAQHFADGGVAGAPQKTVKAYKLFKTKKSDPGKLFPLFVDANTPVPVGQWVDAKAGEPGKTPGKVKSKLGDLAFRPGWHAGDLPVATHIGGRSSDEQGAPPDYRPADQVWAEVEMPDDVDWQSVANSRARISKAGEPVASTAHITDQVPSGGHYRYKTNSNMTGNWMIGGSMRVNRILSDDEVQSINDAAGTADLPRHPDYPKMAAGGRTGFADGGTPGNLPARVVNFKNFYSRGAEAARQLSQKKGSPQQMRAMLVKAGVKPEEFTQSGFDDAFSGKPSVTSEELFQHFYKKMPNIGVDKLLSEDHSSYDPTDPDAEETAQFEDYTLPGHTNYREHRLKLPETNNNFEENNHWPGHKNVVAHIRMADRIEPPSHKAGDRIVEKMLSDPNLTQFLGTEPANWGSGAPDLAVSRGTITKEEAQTLSRAWGWRNNAMKGYKPPRALHVEEIQSDWGQAGRKHGFQDLSVDGPSDRNKPPQGPFVNSTQGWTSLVLKHALTEAVNGGYNKLVFSPGQANADMYGFDEERGSGMKSFYDQIIPAQMNKLVKSLDPDHPGVQMFSHDLPADYTNTRAAGYKGHALEITDGLRDAVKQGLPMYKDGGEVEGKEGGDSPAQNAADHIALLLREDRAKEVTDDLMGQADPKRLHEHYESGNTGMQMPMDEDSRMDRAKALGFDVKAYRGQTGDPGASLNTVRTEGKTAGTGAWATSDPDIAATYSGRENPVSIPMMIKSGEYQTHDFGGNFWGDGPEGKTTDELARASNAPGVQFKNITDVGPYLWNRANVQKRIPETADSFAIKDPKTVRSRFARFDPRLAHLSHLSAATGGTISEKANGGGVNRRLVSSANPMVHKAIALARNLTRR